MGNHRLGIAGLEPDNRLTLQWWIVVVATAVFFGEFCGCRFSGKTHDVLLLAVVSGRQTTAGLRR